MAKDYPFTVNADTVEPRKKIEIREMMSDDEKIIWAAMFASECDRMLKDAGLQPRMDVIIAAAKEADYTIAAIRRLNERGGFEGKEITRGFQISRPEEEKQ